MRIVFDMDNTLADERGRLLRPGIVDLLTKLAREKHTLILWTSSTRLRALEIIKRLEIRHFFETCIYREDYDPEGLGMPKDIRTVRGDYLIDDDGDQIDFVQGVGLKGFKISAYRGRAADAQELDRLHKAIKKADGKGVFSLFK